MNPAASPLRSARGSAGSRTRAGPGPRPSSDTAPGSFATSSTSWATYYGRPVWQRRLDPTSELILTILTQNSADTNAEVAFEALRHRYPSDGVVQAHNPGAGWGGDGLPDGSAPDWAAVEQAPLPELVDTIRPGGLANQKAPRIQATLRHGCARSAATTPWNSWATCPRWMRATG